MTDLLVPIRIDALRLARPERVVGAPSDPAVLPWFDGARDHFGETPYLASAINAEPFGDHQHWLGAGVHLHWALPDALTRGTNRPPDDSWVQVGDLWFPPVPNRWLVVRREPRAAWVVQSDYLHPLGEPVPDDATAYPVDPSGPGGASCRHIGRSFPLDPDHDRHQWAEIAELAGTRQLDSLGSIGLRLSALGPGEPTFAALYSGCRNVFGFHDVEAKDLDGGLSYDVWGWYSRDVPDPVRAAARAYRRDPQTAYQRLVAAAHQLEPPPDAPPMGEDADHLTDEDWARSWRLELDRRFGWRFGDVLQRPAAPDERKSIVDFPDRLCCFSRLTIEPVQATRAEMHGDLATAGTLAVAETAAEAAAAMIASRLGRHEDTDLHRRLTDILRATDLADRRLDLGAALPDAAHAARFRPLPGPSVWVVRAVSDGGPTVGEQQGALPGDVAHQLNELNKAQARYDSARAALDERRQAVFAGWHHFMSASYPEATTSDFDLDVDEIAEFLVTELLEPLDQAIAAAGELRLVTDGSGQVGVASDSPAESIAGEVLNRQRALADRLAATPSQPYSLGRVPGRRFWRPNDPVILVDHPGARATDRHRREPGDSSAGQPTSIGLDTDRRRPAAFMEYVDAIAAMELNFTVFADTQIGVPWNPLLLEWEIELRPDAAGNALDNFYDAAFITRHHDLSPTEPDLRRRGNLHTVNGFDYLAGRTIVNPAAVRIIADRLEALADGSATGQDADLIAAAVHHDDLRALAVLPLGGFHDRLLMRRNEPQLPILDPIGTPSQRALAERVRQAVGSFHPFSPEPDTVFQPIRSGEFVIERLRIIDTFGQTVEWRPESVVTAPQLDGSGGSLIRPPVRFSQPARLDLQWLSADLDDVEVNSHPASSPVCGWIVPNDLDGDLAVYSAEGRLLGSVEPDGSWTPAPGDPSAPPTPEMIANRHTAEVVAWIIGLGSRDPAFVGQFLGAIDAALAGIDPADSLHHASRAVLIGRPLVIVRAQVGISLMHPPTVDESFTAMRNRLLGHPADDHGFTGVNVPIRLGEHHRLDDGLVGYWRNDDAGTLATSVFVSSADPALELDHPAIRIAEEGQAVTIERAIGDRPATVTMLLDPRGAVHATCGVLPTDSISVPTDQYRDALDQLRVTFRAAPVLTSPDGVELPLPREPGFSWSWLQRSGDDWQTIPHHPSVSRSAIDAAFGPRGEAVWAHLVASRRIILEDSADSGLLMPDDPMAPPIGTVVEGVTAEQLEATLHGLSRSVEPTRSGATFDARVVARDGWLALRPVPQHHAWDQPDDGAGDGR